MIDRDLRDVRIATACATSLATFFLVNRDRLERWSGEPLCKSFASGEDDVEIRFTAPYEGRSRG